MAKAFTYTNMSLEDTLSECRSGGEDVLVGYQGGAAGMKRDARNFRDPDTGERGVTVPEYLAMRTRFKVHRKNGDGDLTLIGPPVAANWMKAADFIKMAEPEPALPAATT